MKPRRRRKSVTPEHGRSGRTGLRWYLKHKDQLSTSLWGSEPEEVWVGLGGAYSPGNTTSLTTPLEMERPPPLPLRPDGAER